MAMHSRRRLGAAVRAPVSELPINREGWMRDASCGALEASYELFFPDNKQEELAAKAICSACPVAWQCLDLSIRKAEVWGIWGGMTFVERCNLTQKYRGHTSPAARAAHRRHITELNRKKASDVDRFGRLRPVREGHRRGLPL